MLHFTNSELLTTLFYFSKATIWMTGSIFKKSQISKQTEINKCTFLCTYTLCRRQLQDCIERYVLSPYTARRETCFRTTMFTMNLSWKRPELNPSLRGENSSSLMIRPHINLSVKKLQFSFTTYFVRSFSRISLGKKVGFSGFNYLLVCKS